MSFVYDQKVVDSMYGSHVVSMAVDYGVDLVKMWPLQTNQELENDVKYAENLQVMFSGMMTQVLLKRSEEVDQSVAEAVYEGMDVLPGVDPEIIRTLMDANRAYDVMASYHGVDGIELFMETARILGIDVETRIEKEIQDLMENLSRTMRSASGFEVDDDVAENVGICQSATVDRNEFARRYLASMTVLDALINLMCYGTDDSQEQAIRVLPVLLFVNSMRNQLSIPPTFINAEQLRPPVRTAPVGVRQLVQPADVLHHRQVPRFLRGAGMAAAYEVPGVGPEAGRTGRQRRGRAQKQGSARKEIQFDERWR